MLAKGYVADDGANVNGESLTKVSFNGDLVFIPNSFKEAVMSLYLPL